MYFAIRPFPVKYNPRISKYDIRISYYSIHNGYTWTGHSTLKRAATLFFDAVIALSGLVLEDGVQVG